MLVFCGLKIWVRRTSELTDNLLASTFYEISLVHVTLTSQTRTEVGGKGVCEREEEKGERRDGE